MSRTFFKDQILEIQDLAIKGENQFKQMRTDYTGEIDKMTQEFQHYFIEATDRATNRSSTTNQGATFRAVTV